VSDDPAILARRLERTKAKVRILENMLEDRTRELYQANRELSGSNDFMADVLTSMAGALVVVNDDFTIRLVNARLCHICGWAQEELVGQPVHRVLPEAGSYRASDETTAVEEETVLLTAAGPIPVSLSHGALHGGEGHIYVAIDIRERKAQEAELRAMQQELVAASRKAGMAEVATGVIHNVGNVVTAVNVGLQGLAESNESARLASLTKLVGLLESQDDLEAFFGSLKGAKVPAFLRKVHDALAAEQQSRAERYREVLGHLDHVIAVVARQQKHATRTVALQSLDLATLARQAVQMHSVRAEALGVSLQVQGDATPTCTDQHLVMQILVNLVSNALDACEGCESGGSEVVVRTFRDADGVGIVVTDDGRGIEPDHIERIFQHGFTTRDEGHGFGLHSSANGATTLGGTLVGASDGPGHGATFRLTLPHTAAEAA
jgi:PAS domain S-box-containing protein